MMTPLSTTTARSTTHTSTPTSAISNNTPSRQPAVSHPASMQQHATTQHLRVVKPTASAAADKTQLLHELRASGNGDLIKLVDTIENQTQNKYIRILRSTTDNPQTFQLLLKALQSGHCPTGLLIYPGGNNIGDAGAQAIAQALQSGNCPAGLTIYLERNNIGAAGAEDIAQALQSGNCPAGLTIDLERNNVGAAGAEAIAQALQSGHCPAGLSINLGINNIGATGALAIAQALQSENCPAGLRICLYLNNLGDTGARAIAQALQSGNCPAGLSISLWSNHIGAVGAEAIAQALLSGKCPAGLSIDLRSNNIGDAGDQAITQALQYYQNTQKQLVQELSQQLQSTSSQDPEIWQQLGYVLPATAEYFKPRNETTITLSGQTYTAKQCLAEAERLRAASAVSELSENMLTVLHQDTPITLDLLSQLTSAIKTVDELAMALQLASKGIATQQLHLDDKTSRWIDLLFWKVINHHKPANLHNLDAKNLSALNANQVANLRNVYCFAMRVHEAQGLNDKQFGIIQMAIETTVSLSHLKLAQSQMRRAVTQQTAVMQHYAQQFNNSMGALSERLAQQQDNLSTLYGDHQQLVNQICDIAQCMKRAQRIGTITKVVAGVVSSAPFVGGLFGNLMEAGVNVRSLFQARSFIEGLEETQLQISANIPENVAPLTLGMMIPGLQQSEQCADIAEMKVEDVIQTIGKGAQQQLYQRIRTIAASIEAAPALAANTDQITSANTPAAATSSSSSWLSWLVSSTSHSAETPEPAPALTSSATSSATTATPSTPVSNPSPDKVSSATLTNAPILSRQDSQRSINSQDSGLHGDEGKKSLLAASIKANNNALFKMQLAKVIAANKTSDSNLLDAAIPRSVNAHIQSSPLDLAAHYGRVEMVAAIVDEGGESLRHSDAAQAWNYAEENQGKFDNKGRRITP